MSSRTLKRSQLARLLEIVLLLKSGNRPNARQIAEACEISRRTVFRDLETIESAGVAIEYDPTRQGYRIAQAIPQRTGGVEEWPGLDEVEWFGLAVAVVAAADPGSPAAALGLAGAARSGWLKGVALLPDPTRSRVEAVARAVAVAVESPPGGRPAGEVAAGLIEAIARGVRVRIEASEGEAAGTVVDPYRLVQSAGSWWLVGHSSRDGEVRLFRLASLTSAEPTEDPAIVPPRFDAARWLGRSGSDSPLRTIALRVRPGADLGPFAALGSLVALPRSIARLDTNRCDDLIRLTLAAAGLVEILAPAPLRRRVAELAAATAGQHRSPVDPGEFGGLVG